MADVIFSSIHVVDGQELGDTPQVFVQPSGKRSPRSGETLILFLDMPNASSSMCADVAHAFSEGYAHAPGGLTTALRLAIKLANDRLVELNRAAPLAQRATGSISCAVVNNESVVIAQTGPAIAFARARTGAFERVTPIGELTPAGTTHTIDAFFTHYAWKQGDAFVLSGETSCRGVGDQLVSACMSKGDARLVAGYLNANVKQGRMTGVAFTVDGEPVTLPLAVPVQSHATEAAPASAWSARGAAISTTETASTTPGSVSSQPMTSRYADQQRKVAQGAESHFGQPLAGEHVSRASHFIQFVGRIRQGLGAFSARLLPASPPQAMPVQRPRTTVFGLATAAILLPILVALVVSIGYLQFSGEAARQSLINAALVQVQQAKASNSADSWNKAVTMINDYEAHYPSDTSTFADAKRLAQTQLDKVGKITRVVATPIIDLNPPGVTRRIAASPMGIFILDVTDHDAQYDVLSPQRNGISGKPISLAASKGVTLSGALLTDVSWASTNGSRWRVEGAVLFTKNALYEYNSTNAQMTMLSLPASLTGGPSQVAAGDLYNNTAYLLDPGMGQIWRYNMEGDKLTKMDPYFRIGATPLHDSIDMTIDGAIYTLQKNGTVLKYLRGLAQPFNMSNLPQRMGKVVAIAASGNDPSSGYIYVADSENGAIWVFTKTGDFVKQLRGTNDEFVGMQDMSLDAAGNTIYVNTPGKLYSFQIG